MNVIAPEGEYGPRAKEALVRLTAALDGVAATGSAAELHAAARTITLPTVQARPGMSAGGAHPHEGFVEIVPPSASPMREANPRVYALLLQAHARLLQIWSGFNYLGYQDSYTPPWRFTVLLERARYFVAHAKNAQRDHLNFLSNAEAEELRELSTAQNVELEKASVGIETARVEHASREVAAARASEAMAALVASNAQLRLDDYEDFDEDVSSSEWWETLGSVVLSTASAVVTRNPGAITDAVHTYFGSEKAGAQRELEKKNLKYAIDEAKHASRVARANVQVARSGLIVAGLQRQAALLRHAHALQTLQFMRNRSLNAEQWERRKSSPCPVVTGAGVA